MWVVECCSRVSLIVYYFIFYLLIETLTKKQQKQWDEDNDKNPPSLTFAFCNEIYQLKQTNGRIMKKLPPTNNLGLSFCLCSTFK
mmetsp:Transcript_8196/g.14827  ORF Transcript_8196/g.14827 Transcript_8196/m.14827 type:complete len:85 (-) Transcript_8196:99-353(-)